MRAAKAIMAKVSVKAKLLWVVPLKFITTTQVDGLGLKMSCAKKKGEALV